MAHLASKVEISTDRAKHRGAWSSTNGHSLDHFVFSSGKTYYIYQTWHEYGSLSTFSKYSQWGNPINFLTRSTTVVKFVGSSNVNRRPDPASSWPAGGFSAGVMGLQVPLPNPLANQSFTCVYVSVIDFICNSCYFTSIGTVITSSMRWINTHATCNGLQHNILFDICRSQAFHGAENGRMIGHNRANFGVWECFIKHLRCEINRQQDLVLLWRWKGRLCCFVSTRISGARKQDLPTKTPTLSHELSASSKGAMVFMQRVTLDKSDILTSFDYSERECCLLQDGNALYLHSTQVSRDPECG